MRLLDLFCGAGGAAMGYSRAGFEVVGVDNRFQKNYPFPFVKVDALEALRILTAGGFIVDGTGEGWWLCDFDAIHASPPCQPFSTLRVMLNAGDHDKLIGPTRRLLRKAGVPYVIENVPGAPLESPIRLCGTGFDLHSPDGAQLRRHRLFETSWDIVFAPGCAHNGRTIGIFGSKARDTGAEKRHYTKPKATRGGVASDILFTLADARIAMDIDWMNFDELSQAIPPAYTLYIGSQLMAYLESTPRGE